MTIRELREARARLLTEQRAMLDLADQENRDLTGEEETRYTAMDAEFNALSARIARAEELETRERANRESLNGARNPQQERQPGGANREAGNPTDAPEYRQGFLAYAVNGRAADNLRMDARWSAEERTILGVSITGSGATGGVLAPAALERALLAEIGQQNVMRQLADVRASNSDVEIPYTTTHTTAYLVAEGADFTASTPAFAKKTMKAYKVGALAYVTVEAMQDMFMDMESWIRDDFARAFANLEEAHFISGTGSSQPSGILAGATLGKTAAGTTAVKADELLDLLYALKPAYRKGGSWLMKDATLLLLRKLKDGDGQYIWQPSYTEGQPDRLLGHPLYTSDEMPAATTGNKAVLFGDFKRYRILDRTGLYFQRLNELYATSGQVGFLAYRRYDGQLLDTAAVKYLQMA